MHTPEPFVWYLFLLGHTGTVLCIYYSVRKEGAVVCQMGRARWAFSCHWIPPFIGHGGHHLRLYESLGYFARLVLDL